MSDERPHGARVLIAEDEPMIGRILEHKLRREGHEVIWVRTAAEVEAKLRVEPVDVAIVDATLERDGIDLGTALVGAQLLQQASWLALVEQRDVSAQRRARAAGVAGTVLKPFKPTHVAAAVAALLEAQTPAAPAFEAAP